MRLFVNMMIAFVLAVFVGGGIAHATGLPVAACVTGIGALSFVPMPQGMAFMAIQKEIWTSHIQEELFKGNEFLTKSKDVSDQVLGGKVVHIPQAGRPSKVERNRSSLPATVTNRQDVDHTYALDEFTTDPIKISNAETAELSYDKRNSVLGQDLKALKQGIAEWMLYYWGKDIETIPMNTGEKVAATIAGASGKRFAAKLDVFQTASTALTVQGVEQEGRLALVPARLIPQLFPINDAKTLTLFNSPTITAEERKAGVIADVQGFKIMTRVSAIEFDGDTLKTPDAAVSSDDCESILFWHPDYVQRAVGTIKAFENIGDPTYYGDIYSFLVRAGGSQNRKDHKGLVAANQVVTS